MAEAAPMRKARATGPAPSQKPTIRDVAREAGVGVGTVSRVLSNSPGVSAKTMEKVSKAIAELGFVANPNARKLGGSGVRTVTAVANNVAGDSFTRLTAGIEREVTAGGHILSLVATRGSLTTEQHAIELARKQQARCLILFGSAPGDAGYEGRVANYRKSLAEVGTEVVFFSRPSVHGIPSIDGGHAKASQLIAAHLLGLGHRRIAFIGADSGLPDAPARTTAQLRLTALREALATKGGDVVDLVPSDFLTEMAELATYDLLDRGTDATAIVAISDDVALGVLSACRRRGVRVPDDFSIVGYDGAAMTAYVVPGITTVHIPYHEMGRQVGRLALGKDPGDDLDVEPRLIVRDSTARVRS